MYASYSIEVSGFQKRLPTGGTVGRRNGTVALPDGRNVDISLVQVISRQIVLRSVRIRLLRLLHDASNHLFRVADQINSWLSVSHCRASFLSLFAQRSAKVVSASLGATA